MTTPTYFRPFVLRPVVSDGDLRSTHRTAYASYCYIRRKPDFDRFGPMPQQWAARSDLVATGRISPTHTPSWARCGPQIWKDADASVPSNRRSEAAAFHGVLSLPLDQDANTWKYLVEKFCTERLADYGMIADWAIHFKCGTLLPHAHLLITARGWRKDRCSGRRNALWFGSPASVRAAERDWLALSGLAPTQNFSFP